MIEDKYYMSRSVLMHGKSVLLLSGFFPVCALVFSIPTDEAVLPLMRFQLLFSFIDNLL
jgi:hypothetical protein